jgi:hypothetical protein
LIANAFYLPHHLLPQPAGDDEALAIAEFEDEPAAPNGEARPTSVYKDPGVVNLTSAD